MAALIAASEVEAAGRCRLAFFPENIASIKLHTQAGFRIVGTDLASVA